MEYTEFKDRINEIAHKYNLNLKVTEDVANIYIKMGEMICAYTKKAVLCFINTDFGAMYYFNEKPRVEMLEALCELSKTPLEERQEEKRYIIPLPHLVTTDGEQQYLSNKGGTWFASRKDKELRQTWKERHLKHIPEEYRKYAVEVKE